MNNRTKNLLVASGTTAALCATMLLGASAHAAVTYDTVFSATNAKDSAQQAITDNQSFALYGLTAVAVLMIALRWFKRITKGVAAGRVK